jgi:hypothetical protein
MSDGQSSSVIRHYFVDEAGDPNLFKRHGKVIVGKDGCSQFFLLGLADVADRIESDANSTNSGRRSFQIPISTTFRHSTQLGRKRRLPFKRRTS